MVWKMLVLPGSRCRQRISILSLLLSFALSALAAELQQTGGILSEQEFLTEMPVVLSVSRLAQPTSETPGAVTVIDRDMIRASGFREIPDLFRLVPGFYVGYFNGHEAVVGHGLPNRYFGRVQVLVDGRSVYMPLWGQVHWSDLPLAIEDIERIEVTRGPNAASYGSNSFLGVINIITRHSREDRGGLLSFSAGNKSTSDGTMRYGGQLSDWDYRLTASYRTDEGFNDKNDSKRIHLMTLRADRQLDKTDSLHMQFGYNGGTRGVGGDNELDPSRDRKIVSHFVQFKWQRVAGPEDETSIQFSHSFRSSNEIADTVPYSANIPNTPFSVPILSATLNDVTRSERYDLEFQRNQSLLAGFRFSWGGSIQANRDYAPFYLGTQEVSQNNLQRVFGNGEWRVSPKLILNAGAMFEHNDLTGSAWSPRASINYHIKPDHTIRVGISKALRTPTLLEENANYKLQLPVDLSLLGQPVSIVSIPRFINSGGLKPEEITTSEVGYLGQIPNYGLSIDLRFYRDEIKNVINQFQVSCPVTIPGLLQPVSFNCHSFRNDGLMTVDGIETQLRWSPEPKTQFILGNAYTRTVSYAFDTGVAEDLQRSNPNHILSLLMMHGFSNGLDVSLGYYQVSDMHALGDGQALPTNRRLDARIAKKFLLGGKKAEMGIVIQNLGDPYNEFRWDNSFDRRTFVTFRLEL
ncbi:TonB-dependent receptor plug domain-containing protein [Sulfurirhabdus autotrophica]|uniref:Iron complex outermembrane receptor protein n=2 Tax=Sulfurirhabdus autotrophica TaxID=1706046 RepID=A0A4R3Y8S4_9PROT|nr:TonB-dependent receptor [Sulfurirhabdus autotrophica]TCV87348.1 iron complex outermembrane receptor protein [Sulfurirhabdus autotrophica]